MVFCLFVCRSRTIFGYKKSAHVHLEGWKHGNREVRLNMVCTAVAVVMVAMARTCTCNCKSRHGSAFLDVRKMLRVALNL